MNYYNPYFYSFPQNTAGQLGLFGKLTNSARGLNLGSIISGTQKTLNIINQAIPIIKEASPMIRNAKTMFRIANEFKKEDVVPTLKELPTTQTKEINQNNGPGPTFFL